MARAAKGIRIIVTIILIVFLAGGAALIVPSFVHIDTVTVGRDVPSNVKAGSVVYAKTVEAGELETGDGVLDREGGSIYVYKVSDISTESDTLTLGTLEGTEEVSLSSNVSKALITIPFLGYLSIFAQTTTGMLALGLLIVIIVVLFIISEIMRRKAIALEEEAQREAEDDEFFSGLARTQKYGYESRREKRKAARYEYEDEEDGADYEEENAEPGYADEADTEPAGDTPARELFIETIEDASAPAGFADGVKGDGMTELSAGDTEAMDEELSDGPAFEPLNLESLPDVQNALEAALENQQLNQQSEGYVPQAAPAEEVQELPNGEIELAMPVYTAAELMEKAREIGLTPKRRKDEVTGITLVDFSECL